MPDSSQMTSEKSHKYCFTINNYTADDLAAVKEIDCQRIKAGLEVSESGTPHVQGAIVFRSQRTIAAVCRDLGGRAHLQVMRGTWKDQDYCLKDDNIIRCDDYTNQGQRNDLISFRESIKRGADDVELLEDHLREVAKFPRLINMARQAYSKRDSREFRRLEVIVMYGPAGVGKTKGPYDEGAYVFDDYEDGWWDGYEGEKVILLDEFYGGVKYSKLLKLLDGYQHRLKVKGGFAYARWTKVYITSNKHPCEWYSQGMTDALKRRITKCMCWVGDKWVDDTLNL